MGNRCVIVSEDTNNKNKTTKTGIYLHWYGSEDTVKELLQEAKEKGVRSVTDDYTYGWARLCQICANRITEDSKGWSDKPDYSTGIGIGIVSQLDCHNYDNGVYYINKDFEIVKHTSGEELED